MYLINLNCFYEYIRSLKNTENYLTTYGQTSSVVNKKIVKPLYDPGDHINLKLDFF